MSFFSPLPFHFGDGCDQTRRLQPFSQPDIEDQWVSTFYWGEEEGVEWFFCGRDSLDSDGSTGCNIRTPAEENSYFIGDILSGATEKYDFYNVKQPH